MAWRKILKWLLICIMIGAPAVAIYIIYFSKNDKPEFVTQAVVKGDIESRIVATGTLEPSNFVEVGAQISGQLEKLYVEEGDEVKQGQLLAEIDASVFEIRVQVAEADLEVKQALLKQQIAELSLAESRLKSNQKLIQRSVISSDDLARIRTDVRVLKSKISATQAQIKADKAKILGDKVTLDYAKIYAPISGTVVNLEVREGQTLNANQSTPTILKIMNLNTFTLRSEVSEADVGKLEKGMLLEFATLGKPDKIHQTKVRRILPSPEIVNDVVLYQVLSDVDNQAGELMDAMTAQVFFIESRVRDTLVLPLSAIKEGREGKFVRKLENSEFSRVKVKTGIKNRTHIQILSGLEEGDRVITGFKRFKKGAGKKGLVDSQKSRRRHGGGF